MMASFTEEDNGGCQFFDAHEDTVLLASASDSSSDFSETVETNSKINNRVSSRLSYDVWIQSPESVQDRRNRFFSWLGLSSDKLMDVCSDVVERDVDRITTNSGAVLRASGVGDEFCLSRSSISCLSNGALDLSEELGLRDNFVFRIENSFVGGECNVDDLGRGGEHPLMREEFEKTSGSSPLFQELLQTEIEENSKQVGTKRVKKGWLSRLRSLTCIVDILGDSDSVRGGRAQRVRVHQSKKKLKELSALYLGQDIQAHEGSISTMKFSLDGQYLASAGEDGIVRLWQVVEDDTSNQTNIPDIDPSCMYFTVNHLSELALFPLVNEKISKLKSLRKTLDSVFVVFPPKVFRILEKPLHEFHGHSGKILDLTWSKNNYLLSASDDNTVRLWRVGCDHSLKVFSHSDYVTCVQFNPVDEDYFISGSIDGKVRIWDIPSCQVVDWTDVKDIVTAVCYRPDAQGGIVGSMRGNCRFYNVSDNHLQLDSQICLHSKKKSLCKRITGFQFLPQDSSKVMVTCADSQVRILDGTNVIGKYRGLRNAGNNIYASFTSDGKHIVSACEDSNVYVWNCIDSEEPAVSQAKNIRSCERFPTNASVAIPWCGMKYGSSESRWKVHVLNDNSPNTLPFSAPACFSLSQEFCLESFPRGSATWPEEKLPTSSPLAASSSIRKSQYKFLETSCQSTSSSHSWGLVIVTAGWDGRIRSFHNYGLPVPT